MQSDIGSMNLEQEKSIYFTGIDPLRFIAALFVVLFHYSFAIKYNAWSWMLHPPDFLQEHERKYGFLAYGFLGVQIFFVISGFVILPSAMHKTARQFFAARLLRLYPALFICCTITFTVRNFFPVDALALYTTHLKDYLASLFLMNEVFKLYYIDGAYWTLISEMMFYVFIGLLIFTHNLSRLEYFLMAGLLLFAVYPKHLLIGIQFPKYYGYAFLCDSFCFFSIGSLLCLNHLYGVSKFRCLTLLFAYLLSLVKIFDLCIVLQKIEPDINGIIGCVIYSGSLIVFYLAVKYSWLLRHKPFWRFIGNLAYPLYLIHQVIGYILLYYFSGKLDYSVLVISITAGMVAWAAIIHLYGELPLRNWIRKLL